MLNFIPFILIGLAIIFVFSIIAMLVKRYKRCPSDKLLVVYGRTGKTTNGEISTARVTHGGGAFVWPVVQDYAFLELTPIPIDIQLKNALSKQNIRIDVPSTFTVAISTEKGVMQNAAERLLGLTRQSIAQLAQDIIFGQLRLVVATMDIEQINSDRDVFLDNIMKAVEPEIQKIGLKLINVNITDINDESGYIKALGQEAAAKAINEAKVSVAQKNRDGEIGSQEAIKEQSIKVAEARTQSEIGVANANQIKRVQVADTISKSEIGEADAEQRKRVATASANAKAIEGENIAAVNIATSTSERTVAEAEATRKAITARNVKEAQTNKDSYIAQTEAEKQRAEKDRATQYASIVVPQEIEKQRIITAAEADAEKIRKTAQGEADAKFAIMEAEARGINEILTKQAEGYAKIVEAAGGNAENAVKLMIAEKIEEIVKIQVEAIKNIKIDKITVWENGGGTGEGNSTSNFMQNLLKMVPPMTDTFQMVGTEMPAILQGAKTKADAQKNDAGNIKKEITSTIKKKVSDETIPKKNDKFDGSIFINTQK